MPLPGDLSRQDSQPCGRPLEGGHLQLQEGQDMNDQRVGTCWNMNLATGGCSCRPLQQLLALSTYAQHLVAGGVGGQLLSM